MIRQRMVVASHALRARSVLAGAVVARPASAQLAARSLRLMSSEALQSTSSTAPTASTASPEVPLSQSRGPRKSTKDSVYKRLEAALAKNDMDTISDIARSLQPGQVQNLVRGGLHFRLFRAIATASHKKNATPKVFPREVFELYLRGNLSVGWICSYIVMHELLAGRSEQALQCWVEFLESLSDTAAFTDPLNREAAWSALVAYIDNCASVSAAVDADIAAKLVPIKELPSPRQLREIEGFSRLSNERKTAIYNGLKELRLKMLNLNSLDFVSSLPVDRPLELEERYREVLEKATQSGDKVPEHVYARFIQRFAECTRVNDAFEVWNHMVNAEVAPTITAWNSLLRAAAVNRADREKVLTALWSQMVESGIAPDSDSYCTLIDFCFRTGKSEKALEIFDKIQAGEPLEGAATPSTAAPPKVTLRMFNIVLDGLLKLGKVEEAEKLMAEGVSQGYQPDVVTYNFFMRTYINKQMYDMASSLLEKMLAAGIAPDVSTYTNVIDSVFKQARSTRGATGGEAPEVLVDRLLNEMTRQGIRSNTVTMTAMMAGLVKTSRDIDSARSLFDHMLRRRVMPNARTFSTLIDSELRFGEFERALRYFQMMPRYGVPQGTPIYNQLIHWTSKNRRLPEAYDLFKQLVNNSRTHPNKYTYSFILDGCFAAANTRIAEDVLSTLADHEGFFDYGTHLPRLIPKLASSGITVPSSILRDLSAKVISQAEPATDETSL